MSGENLSLNLKILHLLGITCSGLLELCGMLRETKNWVLPDQEKYIAFTLEPGLQNHSKDDLIKCHPVILSHCSITFVFSPVS